jgi:hypothetical protein
MSGVLQRNAYWFFHRNFMRLRLFVTATICLLLLIKVHSQQWIRIYSDTVNTELTKVMEHYDKGYIFSGEKYEGWTYLGLIMKTDINGYERWSKCFGNPSMMNQFTSVRTVRESGLIASGSTSILNSNCTDPLIVKVNNCGEKEWCKIYDAQGCNSWVRDLLVMPDSGYLALIDKWKNGEEQRIWLFRLNNLGEVIWIQTYATNPDFWSEESHSLLMASDTSFVITGEAYFPDPTYPTKKIIKIILIKVALDGSAIFEVPWGADNGVYSDGRLSVIDSKNNIYTAGRRARTVSPGGDSPCLFKTYSNGDPAFYRDMKLTSSLGISTTINWFQDSTIVQCSGWVYQSGNDTTALIKTDSLGNIIKVKPLLINSASSIYGSDITYNNRVILAGGVASAGLIQAYAFKLTSNLEYDSVYTRPFTYDSLCPHPIVSDTIPLDDCQVVIVGLDDAEKHPEKTKLRIYPNPAGDQVTVEMPQYLVKQNQGNGITATTTYFQWDRTRLDVLNINGKLMFTQDIPKQQTTVQINTSAWPAGMYLARIVFMNEVVGEAKMIITD